MTSFTPEFKSMSERMRYAWEQSGKTQQEIGDYCGGIGRQGVARWMPSDPEVAAAVPAGDKLLRYSEITGFAIEWLVDGVGPMYRNQTVSFGTSEAEQVAECLKIVSTHPLLVPLELELKAQFQLAKALQRTLKPDGSFDVSKVLEVVANPLLTKHAASEPTQPYTKNKNEQDASHAHKRKTPRLPDT